ncbi:FtsX-like permease family protein [Poriferisphaera sp. WC338]|uniref:ABC transporter permease n=1 Tax=Poriferisphaera sp. WC338 TaxID=3425129 RepID=UPI003D812D25
MMVIIVTSVMGGFLDLLRTSAHKLSGDVSVVGSVTGFPYYEEMIAEAMKRPEVESGTPVIRSFGLLNLKFGRSGLSGSTEPVEVMGIIPEQYNQIAEYKGSLLWTKEKQLEEFNAYINRERERLNEEFEALSSSLTDPEEMKQLEASLATANQRLDQSHKEGIAFREELDLTQMGMKLEPSKAAVMRNGGEVLPGMVIGVEVNPYQRRDSQGQYSLSSAAMGYNGALTLVPLTEKGDWGGTPAYAEFAIVNEFKSGLYDVDSNRVYVPLDVVQKKLDMEAIEADPDDPDIVGAPARVTRVLFKSAPGYTPEQTREAVQLAVREVMAKHDARQFVRVQTWEEEYAHLLGAVQNEKGLVTFLFVIISIVSIVMVATTFYMIVLEKTRDIGVMRAIGASKAGIMNLFLGYGFAIGVLGAVFGVLLAYFIVTHLNNFQHAIGHRLFTYAGSIGILIIAATILSTIAALIGKRRENAFEWFLGTLLVVLVGGSAIMFYTFPEINLPWLSAYDATYGIIVWDPQTYFFDRIPSKVQMTDATVIGIAAIISSVIGALIPAIFAAMQDPIAALRYE